MHPPRKMRETQNKIKTRLFENETENKEAKIIEHPFLS